MLNLLAAGAYHTCVILDTGDVKCWGYGFFGQLGYDNSTDNKGDAAGEMASLGIVNLGAGVDALLQNPSLPREIPIVKLRDAGIEPIETIHGVGFRLS